MTRGAELARPRPSTPEADEYVGHHGFQVITTGKAEDYVSRHQTTLATVNSVCLNNRIV